MRKLLVIITIQLVYISAYAQVTIGSNLAPVPGALLDLKTEDSLSNMGLGLPRVLLYDIKTQKDLGRTMGATKDGTLDPKTHVGLMVYNVGKNEESERTRFCPGIHVWNGENWQAITPYPDIKIQETEISYLRGFRYLNPNNPEGWPKDKEAARAAGKYALGRNISQSPSPNGTDNINDRRLGESSTNTYTVSRFYVGMKTMQRKYSVKKSFSCDASVEPNWDLIAAESEPIVRTKEVFDDGIWMTQNLRTIKMPDGTDIIKLTTPGVDPRNGKIPQYYHPGGSSSVDNGILYNFGAAIAIGIPNTNPPNPNTFPDHTIGQGGSAEEDIYHQGICPEGWYLPNDQEWTDLANSIANNVTLFASTLNGNATNVSYDYAWDPSQANLTEGGYLGQAMKSQSKILTTHTATNGKSYAGSQGGFDAYMTGSAVRNNLGTGAYNYGAAAYFWTSSIYAYQAAQGNEAAAYYRFLSASNTESGTNNSMAYFRDRQYIDNCFSIRCKKITK